MATIDTITGPVLLEPNHDLGSFDCGAEPLNVFLRKYALANNRNRSARTYAAVRGAKVLGYYTLAAGSVSKADAPSRVAKGLGNYPVPIVLLAPWLLISPKKARAWVKRFLRMPYYALIKPPILSDVEHCSFMRRIPPRELSTRDSALSYRRSTIFTSSC